MSVELTLLSNVALRGREIAGPRRRALLASLAMDPAGGMRAGRLIGELWPHDPPENPGKALQVLVSRTRAETEAALIANTAGGYRLTLSPDRIDAWALEARAAAAERHALAGDHAAALERAEAALSLWSGAHEPDTGPLAALRAARRPAYEKAREIRALSLARLGRLIEAAAPLAALWEERPGNEEILAELLRAEAAASGLETALARYDAHRHDLRERLGVDPGPALRETHRRLLRANETPVRHGVPHEPNPLLGRDDDVSAVLALLRASRVVTITGPGGLGKSRVAHAAARAALETDVRLVALAGVEDDAQVAAEVGAAFGALAPTAEGRVAGIAQAIGGKRVLLVLDDCERVLDGVAALVGALVALTPELRVLATSRAPLGLSSESLHALPELGLEVAVDLFNRRARAARPSAELRYDEVADLCARLEGLPLAIELAAARVRVMSVAEVTRRLSDRFALLRATGRDTPERHRTMRAVAEWSWRLLDDAGRAAVRLLSVFPGGFTAESAGWVLGPGLPLEETLDVLDRLAAQSLLTVTETAGGTRFRMPATVRDLGLSERAAAGEDAQAIAAFLSWARAFGLAHDAVAFNAPAEAGPVIAEQDNLIRALRHALDAADAPTVAAVFAALGPRWYVSACHSRIRERAPEVMRLLSRPPADSSLVDAVRTSAVVCALNQFTTTGGVVLRALAILRRLPDAPPNTPVTAMATLIRALLNRSTLDDLAADPRSLPSGIAHTMSSLRHERRGDLDTALTEAALALDRFDGTANPWLRYQAHARLGRLALLAEQGDIAAPHLAVAIRRLELLDAPGREDLVTALAMAELQCGDPEPFAPPPPSSTPATRKAASAAGGT